MKLVTQKIKVNWRTINVLFFSIFAQDEDYISTFKNIHNNYFGTYNFSVKTTFAVINITILWILTSDLVVEFFEIIVSLRLTESNTELFPDFKMYNDDIRGAFLFISVTDQRFSFFRTFPRHTPSGRCWWRGGGACPWTARCPWTRTASPAPNLSGNLSESENIKPDLIGSKVLFSVFRIRMLRK